jgi:biopolymer transport protein ExbB
LRRSRILTTALVLAAALALAAPGAGAQQPEEAAGGAVAVEQAGELAPEDQGRTLADWYGLGGWVMHFLVACSMISVTLVVERFWGLRTGKVIPRRFLRQVNEHLLNRDISRALALCGERDTSVSRVLKAGLIHFGEGLARVEDAIETAGAHEQTVLRRNLGVLAALANIATMLGLMGTVLGMIESFDIIAKTGTGDARVVASGIFEALITTASGLMVGIPTIAFHSYFRRRAEVLVIKLEEISFGLIQNLSLESEAASRAPEGGQLTPAEV